VEWGGEVSRRTRILRAAAWAALLTGLGGAVLLWVSAREVVEITRRIVGHATVTFEDLEVRISVARIALGVGSLVFGAFLWSLGRVVAELADAQLGPGRVRAD
jgi:hypothetical protein